MSTNPYTSPVPPKNTRKWRLPLWAVPLLTVAAVVGVNTPLFLLSHEIDSELNGWPVSTLQRILNLPGDPVWKLATSWVASDSWLDSPLLQVIYWDVVIMLNSSIGWATLTTTATWAARRFSGQAGHLPT